MGKAFQEGAAVGGVLQHPGHRDEAAQTLRVMADKYSGPDNAGKVAILEEGMEFKAVALSIRTASGWNHVK